MYKFLFVFILLKSSSCQVCRTSVVQVREVPETYRYSYYEAYQGTDCLIWCTKSRMVTKIGIRMVEKMFNEFSEECCEGYVQNKTNSLNCQPTCDPPCENAICLHPNQCICNPGYVIDANNINTCILRQSNNDSDDSNSPVTPACEKVVKTDTLNETTNIFEAEENIDCPLRVKEQCCNNIHIIKKDSENENFDSHFANNSDLNDFEEATKDNNNNSNSNDSETIGNKSSSFDYYEESPTDPYCTDECINCKCVADETWVCEPGWYFNEDKTECLPHCDACVHGVCKAPNICECFEGYHLSKLSTAECIPDCNCTEGCLIPNVCVNNSKCEKCDNKCSNEIVVPPSVEVIKPTVLEEKVISKSTTNFQDDKHFEEPVGDDVLSQKIFKPNQSNTETKLSGIPIYWVCISAAIGLLFLVVLVILIIKKMKTKFGKSRKFSFVDGGGDKNNIAVQYSTTH